MTNFSAEEFFQEEDARASGVEAPASGLVVWDAGEDEDPIPPRAWLLGNTFCRGFISSILAEGGTGKTAARIAQLLALATGRPLTGEHVFQRSRCLLISLEDGRDELRRRVRAAMRHYGIKPEEVKGWLFLAVPRDGAGKLAVTENGTHRPGALTEWLETEIARLDIDLVSLDPLVKAHGVEENANNAVDFVAGILSRLAITHDIAIDAPHHVSKGASDPGNASRGRGASAFKDAARLVYTLTVMSPEEAEQFGIGPDDRRRFIRVDNAKTNLCPPSAARWFELIGVRIDNANDTYPHGDEIQVAKPWKAPETWTGLSTDALNAALDEIEGGLPNGQRYSASRAAIDRSPWRVVSKHCSDKTEAQCREIIKTWLRNGVLYQEEYQDNIDRKSRKGIRVDATRRPS
jgi:hypothetical protein